MTKSRKILIRAVLVWIGLPSCWSCSLSDFSTPFSTSRIGAAPPPVRIAASCSGSRYRSPISRQWRQRQAFPLFVLPVLAFVVSLVAQSFMLLLSIVVLASGLSATTLSAQLQLHQASLVLLYHLVTAHMLWYAAFYAWLLLVSAWARRTPFLWAVMPPLRIGIFEKVAFHTSHFSDLLTIPFSGGPDAMSSMMGDMPSHPGMHIAPTVFLSTSGMWGGLLVAAALLVGAARVRRYRSPI